MASIRKEGKYYYLYFRIDGKLHKRSLRVTDKKQAERMRKEFEQKRNSLTTNDRNEQNGIPRLERFFEEAHAYSKNHKAASTARRDRRVYNNFLRFVGNISLADVNFRLIERYVNNQLARNLKPAGINLDLRHLGAAFTVAIKYEYLTKNPFHGYKKLRVPKRKPIFLTRAEANMLLHHVSKRTIYLPIVISLNTGARAGEVLYLKWQDIDFENGSLRLFGKGDKERTVPLTSMLREVLTPIRQLRGHVVGARKVDTISKAFRQAADEVGLEHVTFHHLRHTYASWLVQNNVSLKVIQELLGHASITTTLQYAHLSPDSRFAAARALDKYMGEDMPKPDGQNSIKEIIQSQFYGCKSSKSPGVICL